MRCEECLFSSVCRSKEELIEPCEHWTAYDDEESDEERDRLWQEYYEAYMVYNSDDMWR